ncbi:MAG TPA: ABC transporter permease [Fulvivirga sp.]|nr:ABC transporter permease [Fulvivirga sp.]
MNIDNNVSPPKWSLRFFRWYCHADFVEDIEGDLLERFEKRTNENGIRSAKMQFSLDVIRLFRPGLIKPITQIQQLNQLTMYQHNLKIGLRVLLKNKSYSLINISGLAIGMAVALLIGLYVQDELSFNKYNENYNRIAQVLVEHHTLSEEVHIGTSLPPAVGSLLKDTYGSQFDQVVMVRSRPEERILRTSQGDFAVNGYFMQPDGSDMFALKMIAGSLNGLKDINSILLSEKLAEKLFHEVDPINQIVKMNGKTELIVTGVYEDLPRNSTFHDASFFAPLDLYVSGWTSLDVWDNFFISVYAKLKKGANVESVNSLIKNELQSHIDGSGKRFLRLNEMSKWHLYSEFENGKSVMSERLKYIWLFLLIAVFVLSLAIINFINLNTARSERRSKEIGVRKSIGSLKRQLVSQFLTESILISFIGFVFALALIVITIPWFSSISGKEIILPFGSIWFWIIGLGTTVIIGLMAGSYPAFYLASFNPIKHLSGSTQTGKKGALPRKVLVVFQFTISIVLIIGTLVVFKQIQHVKNRPLGFNRSNLLMIPKRVGELYGKYDVFQNELNRTGAVLEIGEASYPLSNNLGNNDGFSWEGKDPSFDPSFNTILVNYDYGKVIDWEILEGRDFTRDITSDVSNAIIITQSAKEIMGLKDPVGTEVHFSRGYLGGPDFTIVGVVNDLIKGDPFQKPKPAFLFLSDNSLPWMFIRLNPEMNIAEAITKVENVFKKVTPSVPFDYKFMDQEYEAKFKSEEQIGKLVTVFAVLAIFISCLGLFGLASYLVKTRMKEISIRKVLGASVNSLWRLLTGEFIILVIIACVIATPLANYLLDSWLQHYDYRIEIGWWIFAIAALSALAITVFTISHQIIKAAFVNPVKNLKSE